MTDHDGDGAATGGWRDQFGAVADGPGEPHGLGQFVADEQNSELIRSYQPELIPGLLQLAGTASAIAGVYFPKQSEDERAQFVAARIERAAVLRQSDAPRFSVLIGENALHKEWGSPDVRRAQLDALTEAVDGGRPNVELLIVPAGSEPATGQDAFVVMSLKGGGDVVWREMAQSSERIEAEQDVKQAIRSFERLEGSAYPPAEARGLIKKIRDSLA